MNKILLVIEDFSELSQLEMALKKLGFNTASISSEFTLSQQVLTFNPELIIASGKGPKVTAMGVGRRLKEMSRWSGIVILAFPQGYKPVGSDLIRIRMDQYIESPVQALSLVPLLAKHFKLDEKSLMEKLKMHLSSEEVVQQIRKSQPQSDSGSDENFYVSGNSGVHKKEVTHVTHATHVTHVTDSSRNEVQKSNTSLSANVNSNLNSDVGSNVNSQLNSGLNENLKNPSGAQKENENLGQITQAPVKTGKVWTDIVSMANAQAQKKLNAARDRMKDMTLDKKSTITKQGARQALKDMKKDWNSEDLKKQDKERQEFTRFLFKKKV